MSFSTKVKEELAKHISNGRHCQLAELGAIYDFNNNQKDYIIIESERVARKCFTLLKKTYNMCNGLSLSDVESKKNGSSYEFDLTSADGNMVKQALMSPTLIQKACCRRAYLRGAFLSAGSISDPEKSYHFEIVCQNEGLADKVKEILASFDIEAKIIARKKHYIVYIKEGAGIVEALNVMEGHVALMDFENSRILREMRNSVNRRVNCEAANISKTVSAAVNQIEDIKLVMGLSEYKELPETIKEIAELRLKNPEVSLKELGELCSPPVGKSGVNHRLRKISNIAERYRVKEEQ